jgi:hypothetical protein
MMKTWSANILYAWKKVFVRSFKLLCKALPSEATNTKSLAFALAMSLNDKQQPLPTKICGSYVISKLSFMFVDPQ